VVPGRIQLPVPDHARHVLPGRTRVLLAAGRALRVPGQGVGVHMVQHTFIRAQHVLQLAHNTR
jgi:hypothetical protein